MKTFTWDQYFATGLETVDQQHRRFVDLINRLGGSLRVGDTEQEEFLRASFNQLFLYAQHQFAKEERLMLKAGVAPQHRDPHCENHRQFIVQLLSMWHARKATANPSGMLHAFLNAWLGFHILGEDRSMARQIELIEIGESAARAYEIETAQESNKTAALLKALQNLYDVVSKHNRDLAAANRFLEQRAAERTRELVQADQAPSDANHRPERASGIDDLLGIPNRRCFNETLEREWRRAAREQKPLSLMVIDMDHLKHYNDRYGHQAGDKCLQSIAKAADSALRRAGDQLARYGGGELAAIMPNTDLGGAHIVAFAICAKVANLQIPHGASPTGDRVSVSIGLASLTPTPQTNPSYLIAAADRALHTAKQSGRNQVCFTQLVASAAPRAAFYCCEQPATAGK
jgi:diguanylate cyclase (GGDEF)-like protein/hemerythrin-like metal-binding protein